MDRDEFMDFVYDELYSDGDNNRANRIIDAADEYVESAQLGTNLAEVGTEERAEERTKTHARDCIDRQAALDIFDDYNVAVENGQIEAYSRDRKRLCDLPPAQPEIIRCKDCKHRDYWGSCKKLNSVFNGHKTVTFDNNFYCSFAEGKEADG